MQKNTCNRMGDGQPSAADRKQNIIDHATRVKTKYNDPLTVEIMDRIIDGAKAELAELNKEADF